MHIGRIVTHPSNPAIVYVAAQGSVWGPGGERGLYRTMDGGKTWQRTLHVDDDTGVTDVVMDSLDPNILYAASYQRRRSAFGFNGGGPGSALWKSTDAGATWTRLTGNGLPEGEYGRIGISVYRKDPRVVMVSIEQGSRYNASTAYIERKAGLYRSGDAGKTWRFMSNWNPRPMYASQPTIDPQDDRRVYMLNAYSFSDNGGESFTAPNTTTHGDDRFVWINPKDSRHVIKLDDGGIGISFDRGLKFLYVQSLPVSQYYRVAVDNERPYNIYGGLQDNGCWRGPSASWTSSGILNEHWLRLCGGDGFFSVPDPANSRVVFSASQFLGPAAQRHADVDEPGHPPRRSAGRHRRPAQLEHLGQERARSDPRQRDAPRQLGCPDRAVAVRPGHDLRRCEAPVPLARSRHHVGGPRRHDHRRGSRDPAADGPPGRRDRALDRRRRAVLPGPCRDRPVASHQRPDLRGHRRWAAADVE